MPVKYALRDAFGCRDLIEDTKETFRGKQYDYRTFDSGDNVIAHEESNARVARMMAGMRYERGGKGKYWIPKPQQVNNRTPLLSGGATSTGPAPEARGKAGDYRAADPDWEIAIDAEDERLYTNARALEFGDWNVSFSDYNTVRGQCADAPICFSTLSSQLTRLDAKTGYIVVLDCSQLQPIVTCSNLLVTTKPDDEANFVKASKRARPEAPLPQRAHQSDPLEGQLSRSLHKTATSQQLLRTRTVVSLLISLLKIPRLKRQNVCEPGKKVGTPGIVLSRNGMSVHTVSTKMLQKDRRSVKDSIRARYQQNTHHQSMRLAITRKMTAITANHQATMALGDMEA